MKLYYSSQLALNPGWTFKLADNILIGQITDDTSGACYNVYRYGFKISVITRLIKNKEMVIIFFMLNPCGGGEGPKPTGLLVPNIT